MSNQLTVVGGGITGLAAAYLAAKAGRQVTVLEASPKMGGLLQTFEVGGTRLEFYYHHFFTHDAEIAWLLKELGLSHRVEYRRSTMGVYRNGRIFDFNGPKDLLRFSPMGILDKAQFTISSLYLGKVARWEDWEGVSALDWFYRYAGRRATESLWKPMLQIKFGPYAGQVPVAWMAGRLRQRMTSRKGTEERLGYLRGSLQTLLDALLYKLTELGVELVCAAPVTKLEIENGILGAVQTPKGRFPEGDFLVTIPVTHLAPLLREANPDYAGALSQIQYFGAVCVVLELRKPLSHIYWLNIADPGFPFGGVIEHTNLVSPSEYEGRHIVYLSRYFAQSEPLAKASTDEISSIMLPHLKKVFPHFNDADLLKLNVFRTATAAPVCDLNFSKRVPACASPVKNLYLANMSHIYPDERSCNNSIRLAAEAGRVLGLDTAEVPVGASLSGRIGMR